jgi:hypothetical protein
MTEPTAGRAALIAVEWGYDTHSIRLEASEWTRVKEGLSLRVPGDGYYYEGEFFQDYWNFSGGRDGKLAVEYGDGGGVGFKGSLTDASIDEIDQQCLNIWSELKPVCEGSDHTFHQLRQRKWKDRTLLVSGEWSESPHHEGRMRFEIARSGKFLALYLVGFPTSIVVIAETNDDVSLERVAAAMMKQCKRDGLGYIDLVHAYGTTLNQEVLERFVHLDLD